MAPAADDRDASQRPSLLEPSRLDPVPVDLRRVFLAGTALWVLALVVCLVLEAADVATGANPAVCVTGITLGGLALAWEHRQRVRVARGETLV